MNRKPPPNKIVMRLNAAQVAELAQATERNYQRGWEARDEYYKSQVADLQRQKAQLELDQTKAVTDLLRAAGENLSKAGYLIGKLNKDNSR